MSSSTMPSGEPKLADRATRGKKRSNPQVSSSCGESFASFPECTSASTASGTRERVGSRWAVTVRLPIRDRSFPVYGAREFEAKLPAIPDSSEGIWSGQVSWAASLYWGEDGPPGVHRWLRRHHRTADPRVARRAPRPVGHRDRRGPAKGPCRPPRCDRGGG